METIYSEITKQLKHFREELDNLKNNTITKNVEKKDTECEGFTLETAKQYLAVSDISLSYYTYSMYENDVQKRNYALKSAIHKYGKEKVEKKLLALICVWSTKAINNHNYYILLNRLQIDYATMKSLP
jgi:hypothetical protein